MLRNVTKEEAVQYVLALINDMLSGMSYMDDMMCNCEGVYARVYFLYAVDGARAQLFHQQSDVHLANQAPDPYSIFLR